VKLVNLTSQRAIKLSVSQPGWYRIALSTLTQNGLAAGNAKLLHLYAEGVEQPLELHNGAVEFYGTPIDTPSTGTRVYWLANGALSHDHIASSTASGGPSAGPDFPNTVELLQHDNYFGASPTGAYFFGDLLPLTLQSNASNETISAPNLSRPDGATLEVGLQGAFPGSHNVTVALNGKPLGSITFSDLANTTMLFDSSVVAPAIVSGANTVTLTTSGQSDLCYLDHITLTAKQIGLFLVANDQQRFQMAQVLVCSPVLRQFHRV
jgi:hypothetical protein